MHDGTAFTEAQDGGDEFLTVGDLRRIIEGLPDCTPVAVWLPTIEDWGAADEITVVSTQTHRGEAFAELRVR